MTRDLQAPPSQPATIFVGREREMALLRAALAAAVGGQGRLVFLSGEPGIGKTRLAEELAHHAAAEAAVVRWGRCREDAGAPAFWPWIQVLRAQIRETNPEELRAQLGCGADEIVRLVPDLPERLPGVAAAPLADDAGARFRLFDSVAGFLRASAAAQPLVLILEDLHWAQAPAVQLLRFLAEEMQGCRRAVAVCSASRRSSAWSSGWAFSSGWRSSWATARPCCGCSTKRGTPTSWSRRGRARAVTASPTR